MKVFFLCNTYNQIFELENKEQNFCHTFLSIKRTLNEMILDKKKKSRGFVIVKSIIVCVDMIDESIKQYKTDILSFVIKRKKTGDMLSNLDLDHEYMMESLKNRHLEPIEFSFFVYMNKIQLT
jgi:hypothetical protein